MLSIPCIPPIALSIWGSIALAMLWYTLPIFCGLRFLTCFSSLKSSFTPPICFSTQLLELVKQGVHLHLHNTSSTGNPGDSSWLFGECLESIHFVKFLVIHAVHDGHQALQPFHALLITHLSIAPLTSPKYRT